jgi:hypothetical protein
LVCGGHGGVIEKEHDIARLARPFSTLTLLGARKAGYHLGLIILEDLEFLHLQIFDVCPFLVSGNDVHQNKIRLGSYDLSGSVGYLGRSIRRSPALGKSENQPRSQNSDGSR